MDIALLIWIVIGTVAIKGMIRLLAAEKISRVIFAVAGIAITVAPLIFMRANILGYSNKGFVLAGVIVFWFALLIGRGANAP